MKRMAVMALAVATLALLSASVAAQQPIEYKVTVTADVVKGSPNDHFITFNTPVQVPDVTLPAGTYIFKFLGSSVIQVSSANGSEQYAMFFTAPTMRSEALDEYQVTLAARDNDAPQIAKIFLPNREVGFQLLYTTEGARGDR